MKRLPVPTCLCILFVITQHANSVEGDWTGPSGPVATLLPAVHWSVDTSDLANLRPADIGQLYYTVDGIADPYSKHMFTNIQTNYTYPSVVVEHSVEMDNVQCAPAYGLDVAFKSQIGFSQAQQVWGGPFVLVSHTITCAQNVTGQRAYWLVHSIIWEPAKLTAEATCTEIGISDAHDAMDLTWGTYEPASDSLLASRMLPAAKRQSGVTGTCGSPPAATISGFPAVACGPDFDPVLDATIGFLDVSSATSFSASWQEFAPGLGNTTTSSKSRRRRSQPPTRLSKRGIFDSLVSAVESVGSAISSAVTTVADDVADVVTTAVDAVGTVYDYAVNLVENGASPSISDTLPINLVPGNLVSSAFGPAYQLYETSNTDDGVSYSLAVYCVNCGITGSITLQGQLSFSLSSGISSGSLGLNGNVQAAVNLGLDAEFAYTPPTVTQNILMLGVPGFSIPEIITIGPELSLDATLDLSVTASGQVLVGASASIPDFAANLDVINSANSYANGFTPVFSTTFEASGSVAATAALGLPMSVGIGIAVPLLNVNELLAVINTPSVEVAASYDSQGQCSGVAYEVSAGDSGILNFFNLDTISLYTFGPTSLAQGCIGTLSSRSEVGHNEDSGQTTTWDWPNGPWMDGGAAWGAWGNPSATQPGALWAGPVTSRVTAAAEATVTPTTSLSNIAASSTSSALYAVPLPPVADTINQTYTGQLANFTAETAEGNTTASSVISGFNWSAVSDISTRYSLNAGSDGNFYLVNSTEPTLGLQWGTWENATLVDSSFRVMYYFPDQMAAFGVSRFRMANDTSLPITANAAGLAPVNYTHNQAPASMFVAIDTLGNAFYPIMCNYYDANTPAKMFLAKDPAAGVTTLQSNGDLRYILTGGNVKNCGFMPWVVPGTGVQTYDNLLSAVHAWQANTGRVSNFLDNVADNSSLTNSSLLSSAAQALLAEIDELNQKAVLDDYFGTGDDIVSAANNVLVAQGTFQFVVDGLTTLSVQGDASEPLGLVDQINTDRCRKVLPAIDAYFSQVALITGTGALKAIRPLACE